MFFINSSYHFFKNSSFRNGSKEDKGKILIGFGLRCEGICSILALGSLRENCLLASNSVLNKSK
jgi:hypothetical protein